MDEAVVEGLEWTTTRGKILQVKRHNPYGFMRFQFKDGGEIPKELSSNYTNFKDVNTAATKYMSRQPKPPHNADKPRPEIQYKEVTPQAKRKKELAEKQQS